MTQTKFPGFPKKGVKFLNDLSRNNNREWFNENKQFYKEFVEEPAKELELAVREKLDTLTGIDHGGKVFRIYRDVRFSKDKTPYNTYARILWAPSDKNKGCGDKPAFYLSIEPKTIRVGMGLFEFSKPLLDAYRNYLVDEKTGAKFARIIANLEKKGFNLKEPELKKVPRGFDPDHPNAEFFRHKSISIWQNEPHPSDLFTPKSINYLLKCWKNILPLHQEIIYLTEKIQ